MRMTITLDDHLVQELEKRASESGSTVSRLIEESVRTLVSGRSVTAPREKPFDLVTYGRGGRFSHHDIDKISSLQGSEDLERYGKREG